jgi:hypothetical protein
MNSKFEILCEKVAANTLKESTTSGDISQVGSLIAPMIQKIFLKSLTSQVCDTQPMTGPTGRVAALYSLYSGDGSSAETATHPDSSYIVYTSPAASGLGLSIGDTVTEDSSTDTFKVIHIEGEKLLLALSAGSHVIQKTNTFNAGAFTISYATPNRAAIKKLFQNYSGSFPYKTDDNTAVKFIGFETRTNLIETVSRKLKSKFSFEQLQDMVTIYNEKGIETASEYLADEIREEIDKEFIEYMKYISSFSTLTPVALSNSIAVGGGGMKDVSDDLIMNIFLAAENIVRNTKRNRTIFILADPITCAFLQVNAFVTKASADEKNPYKIGSIGTYPLFVDLFAEADEHFIIVGYQGSGEGDGDSGIIFAPYSSSLHVVDDKEMKTNMMIMNRYAMVRHPQDIGNKIQSDIWDSANASNSDFFKMFIVDYGTSLVNLTDITIPVFE